MRLTRRVGLRRIDDRSVRREQAIEAEQVRKLPDFRPGDTIRVHLKILEGDKERVQAFEGVCIARANKGIGSNFTVRKMSFGEGVERVFPLYSPTIDSITVVRKGVVRRAKLYYLRDRRGKSARIAERQMTAGERAQAAADRAGPSGDGAEG